MLNSVGEVADIDTGDKGLFITYNHAMFMKPHGEIVYQVNRGYLHGRGKG